MTCGAREVILEYLKGYAYDDFWDRTGLIRGVIPRQCLGIKANELVDAEVLRGLPGDQ
jgi:hypothetical protein